MPPRHGHGDTGPPPQWKDVGTALPPGLDPATDRRTAWDRCLALTAVGVPNHASGSGGRWRVHVPPEHLERAASEIVALSGENRSRRAAPAPPEPGVRGDAWTVILAMGLLAVFHVLIRRAWPDLGLSPADWLALGEADSTAMLAGAMVARSHGPDPARRRRPPGRKHAHRRRFPGPAGTPAGLGHGPGPGPGLGCGGQRGQRLAARPGGNLSVGASTAVFGAVGVLAALRAVMERRLDPRRTLIPVAAGLGLLSMLGTAGENTDLWAHLSGFAAGLTLGALSGLIALRRGLPGPAANALCGLAAPLALAWAWLAAFAP